MPEGDLFNSKKNIAIGVKPKELFSKGDVMKNKKTGKYDSRFKTVDTGEKGGLRVGIGKLKSDVRKEGKKEAKTTIQRYLVEQEDFKIKNKQLTPKTSRGRKELKQITNRHGKLEYLGEEQFIVKKNRDLFKEQSYYSKSKGGVRKKNKLNKESIDRLKKASIPQSVINRANAGKELTDVENEILHKKGLEIVRSSKRSSFVREYTGGTETRMKNLKLANKTRGL